jgi:hypothetical protein
MALTYVPIANLALQHIGEDDRIDAPDETKRAARIVKNAWDGTFEFILGKANWAFAVRTVELAERAADPEFPIALERRAFPLPADMVRFIEIIDPALDDEDDSYSIEGGPDGTMEILTEIEGPITVRYVRKDSKIADPLRWPPQFIEAFTWELAWQISDPLSADKARKDRARKQADIAIAAAKRANNRTKGRRGAYVTPWVAARTNGIQRAPGV